jgi:hypothetical protein
MAVILDPDSYDLWLDPGMTNVEAVSEMLKPFDARLMRCSPVSTRINYVANDDAECSVSCLLFALTLAVPASAEWKEKVLYSFQGQFDMTDFIPRSFPLPRG